MSRTGDEREREESSPPVVTKKIRGRDGGRERERKLNYLVKRLDKLTKWIENDGMRKKDV